MMDAPDPPETPNPYASAAAQTGANVNTAIANTKMQNANVYGPTGSSEFTQTGTHQIKEARKNKDGTVMTQKVWKPDDPEAAAQYRREVEGTPTKTWIATGGDEGQGGYYQETGGGKRYIDTRTGKDWVDGGQWVDEIQYDTYDVPTYRQDIKLSENQQRLLNYQEGAGIELGQLGLDQIRKLQGVLGDNFSLDKVQGLQNRQTTVNQPNMDNVNLSEIDRLKRIELDRIALDRIGDGPQLQENINARNLREMQAYRGQVAGTTYDANGMPDFSGDRRRVEEAIYSRLNPELEREKAALDNKLVNEGFQRGTEAYNRAMDEYARQANDARMQAILAGGQEQSRMFGDALAASNFQNQAAQLSNSTELQAQNQLFGQAQARQQALNEARQQMYGNEVNRINLNNQFTGAEAGFNNAATVTEAQFNNAADVSELQFNNDARMQQAGFNNQARQFDFANQMAAAQFGNAQREAQIQEALMQRQIPINEISALMSGSQVQMPQFAGFQAANIPTTPVGDYIYRTAELDQRNYQAELAAQQASMSGLFGLGSSLIGGMFKLSDRRVKTDIEWVGTERGLGVYRFRYIAGGPPQIGYMADEVKALYPHAVITEGGIDRVNYERIAA